MSRNVPPAFKLNPAPPRPILRTPLRRMNASPELPSFPARQSLFCDTAHESTTSEWKSHPCFAKTRIGSTILVALQHLTKLQRPNVKNISRTWRPAPSGVENRLSLGCNSPAARSLCSSNRTADPHSGRQRDRCCIVLYIQAWSSIHLDHHFRLKAAAVVRLTAYTPTSAAPKGRRPTNRRPPNPQAAAVARRSILQAPEAVGGALARGATRSAEAGRRRDSSRRRHG